MRLSDDALGMQTDYLRWLEGRIGEDGDLRHMSDWVGKAQRGHSSRIAGILHALEREDPFAVEVSEGTMGRALDICQYYLAHARRAYAMAFEREEDGVDLELCGRIIKYLRREGSASLRQAYRHVRCTKLEAEAAMAKLESHHWVFPRRSEAGASYYEFNAAEPVAHPRERAGWPPVATGRAAS